MLFCSIDFKPDTDVEAGYTKKKQEKTQLGEYRSLAHKAPATYCDIVSTWKNITPLSCTVVSTLRKSDHWHLQISFDRFRIP